VRLHEGLTRARRPAWDCGAALAAPADVHDVPRERSGVSTAPGVFRSRAPDRGNQHLGRTPDGL